MVLTRAEREEARKEALTHVLKNVFELDDDTPLSRALSKDDLLDIGLVVNFPFENIDKLTYIDNQGDERDLAMSYKVILHIFKSYFLHRRNQGNPIGDNWTGITSEDMNNYRFGPHYTFLSFPTRHDSTPHAHSPGSVHSACDESTFPRSHCRLQEKGQTRFMRSFGSQGRG